MYNGNVSEAYMGFAKHRVYCQLADRQQAHQWIRMLMNGLSMRLIIMKALVHPCREGLLDCQPMVSLFLRDWAALSMRTSTTVSLCNFFEWDAAYRLSVPVDGVAQQGGHQIDRLHQHIEGRCVEAAAVRNPQLSLHMQARADCVGK